METSITLRTTKQVKKAGFKNAYEVESEETKTISLDQYKKITDAETVKLFRRLGGSEYVTKNYTSLGFIPVKIISTSPDREEKTIREFSFESKPVVMTTKRN